MRRVMAHLSYQKDTLTSLSLEETTTWQLVLEDIGDGAFGLLAHLCNDWAYSIRWGPKDPEYGISFHSLGSKLFDLSQWCGGGFGSWKKHRQVAEIPVSFDWVREHMPEAGWPWDGSDPEDAVKGAA